MLSSITKLVIPDYCVYDDIIEEAMELPSYEKLDKQYISLEEIKLSSPEQLYVTNKKNLRTLLTDLKLNYIDKWCPNKEFFIEAVLQEIEAEEVVLEAWQIIWLFEGIGKIKNNVFFKPDVEPDNDKIISMEKYKS